MLRNRSIVETPNNTLYRPSYRQKFHEKKQQLSCFGGKLRHCLRVVTLIGLLLGFAGIALRRRQQIDGSIAAIPSNNSTSQEFGLSPEAAILHVQSKHDSKSLPKTADNFVVSAESPGTSLAKSSPVPKVATNSQTTIPAQQDRKSFVSKSRDNFLAEDASATNESSATTRQPHPVASASNSSQTSTITVQSSRRFPRFGTPEFLEKCNWTFSSALEPKGCTSVLRPRETETEGIASWIFNMLEGYILTKLQGDGCQLMFDYGPNVDINQVLVPNRADNNWTIPSGYTSFCNGTNCSEPRMSSLPRKKRSTKMLTELRKKVPRYRSAYKNNPLVNIYRKRFLDVVKDLPGFRLETAIPCSAESLLELSPLASQFEPQLFTHILPTLRDERNLVLTLYYRTGQTDQLVGAEKQNRSVASESEVKLRKHMDSAIPCILETEKAFLSNLTTSFSRVVWLVVSDSPRLKRLIHETYSASNLGSLSTASNSTTMPREIITTQARGIHTKTSRQPSTIDFAEGMIDWYLMGESDIVFVNGGGFTYGTTAALRTGRPLFDYAGCHSPMQLIHDEDPPPKP